MKIGVAKEVKADEYRVALTPAGAFEPQIPHPPGPLTGIGPRAQTGGARLIPPYRIAAGAVVEPGAEIGPAAVIGARAHIRGTAKVRNAVVWADTVVDGELDHAVATPEGVVSVPAGVSARLP